MEEKLKNMEKLKIAIQTKGRLNEDSMELIRESGIDLSMGRRKLVSTAGNFPMEALFLRDDDIPQTVADGVSDVGIVGENEMLEKQENVVIPNVLGSANADFHWLYPKTPIIRASNILTGKK